MITVKLQQNLFPELSAYMVDITERIAKKEITALEERIENDRFSFRANDIDIKGINNSDGFIEVAFSVTQLTDVQEIATYGDEYYYNYPKYGYTFRGAIVYIYWKGIEFYRGYSRPDDISISPVNPKTVDIRSFNWLKRLEEFELDNFDGKADVNLLLEQIEETFTTDFSRLQPMFSTIHKDLDPLEFDATVEMGTLDRIPDKVLSESYEVFSEEGSDLVSSIKDLAKTQYQDIWVDPRTNRAYGVRFSNDRRNIELYRIRGQYEYLLKSWRFARSDSDFTYIADAKPKSKIHFIRSIIDDHDSNIAIVVNAEVTALTDEFPLIAIEQYVEFYILDERLDRMYRERGASDIDTVRHNILVLNNSILEKSYPIICDGDSYYELIILDGSTVINQYSRHGILTGVGGVVGSFENINFNAPTKNRVVFYRTLASTETWKILNFDTFTPVYSEGALLPTALTSNADSNELMTVYPIGYVDDAYNGKYAYFLVEQEYSLDFILDLPLIDETDIEYKFIFNSWQINDMIWVALSSIYYDSTVSLMEILLDLCQVTNGVVSTSDGILNIYSRLKYVETHTLSQDYMKRNNYSYNLNNTDNDRIKLSFATECLQNPPEIKFSNKVFTDLLKKYYNKEYTKLFKVWTLEIPLEIGLNINLSDKIIIQETGDFGVVIEKETSFQSGERMVKLTVEFEQLTLSPREAM